MHSSKRAPDYQIIASGKLNSYRNGHMFRNVTLSFSPLLRDVFRRINRGAPGPAGMPPGRRDHRFRVSRRCGIPGA
jgi:hypothetical protein